MRSDWFGLALIGAALWWLYGRTPAPAPTASQVEVNQDTASGLPTANGGAPSGGGGSLPGGGSESGGGSTGTYWALVPVCSEVVLFPGANPITQCSEVWMELPSGHPPLLDA